MLIHIEMGRDNLNRYQQRTRVGDVVFLRTVASRRRPVSSCSVAFVPVPLLIKCRFSATRNTSKKCFSAMWASQLRDAEAWKPPRPNLRRRPPPPVGGDCCVFFEKIIINVFVYKARNFGLIGRGSNIRWAITRKSAKIIHPWRWMKYTFSYKQAWKFRFFNRRLTGRWWCQKSNFGSSCIFLFSL